MSKSELYSPQVEDIHTLKQNGVMEVTNMDQYVTGAVIKRLREEKNMTQHWALCMAAAIGAFVVTFAKGRQCK